MAMAQKIRLQKWLAEMGLASRREAEGWITAGRLHINQQQACLGDRVDPSHDLVTCDHRPIVPKQPPKVYWLLHKPVNTLSSRACDPKTPGRERIFDLPSLCQQPLRVFSVGRLDYKTEGLLLLTNDGAFSESLCHPRYHLPRYYQVLVSGQLTASDLQRLQRGVALADGLARCDIRQAQSVNLGRSRGRWYFVTVYEGRNRLVRRLFEFFDRPVVRLVRYGFGPLRLDPSLKPGCLRHLSASEIKSLRQESGLKRRATAPASRKP